MNIKFPRKSEYSTSKNSETRRITLDIGSLFTTNQEQYKSLNESLITKGNININNLENGTLIITGFTRQHSMITNLNAFAHYFSISINIQPNNINNDDCETG